MKKDFDSVELLLFGAHDVNDVHEKINDVPAAAPDTGPSINNDTAPEPINTPADGDSGRVEILHYMTRGLKSNTYSKAEEKGVNIHRTPEGYVDAEKTYKSVSVRLPAEWADYLRETAREKRISQPDFIVSLLKKDAETNR